MDIYILISLLFLSMIVVVLTQPARDEFDEKVFTKENCSKVQLTTENGEVYGIYNNLECTGITKNLEDSTVLVTLKQLDDLTVKVEDLQNTVDMLVIGEVM